MDSMQVILFLWGKLKVKVCLSYLKFLIEHDINIETMANKSFKRTKKQLAFVRPSQIIANYFSPFYEALAI